MYHIYRKVRPYDTRPYFPSCILTTSETERLGQCLDQLQECSMRDCVVASIPKVQPCECYLLPDALWTASCQLSFMSEVTGTSTIFYGLSWLLKPARYELPVTGYFSLSETSIACLALSTAA